MKTTDKKFLYIMLFLLELALVIIAFVLTLFAKTRFASLFSFHSPALALFIIITAGAGAAVLISLLVVKLSVFSPVYDLLKQLVAGFKLSIADAFVIALTAGICEEILFRAVLQPMWGIWITSFVFILLHGYFNPLNWRMSLFGLLMFCLSLAIGFVYMNYGLIPAMALHFTYDFTALTIIKTLNKNAAA